MAPFEFNRLGADDLSAAAADLGPAVLVVPKYGCAPRPDLGDLATKSRRLRQLLVVAAC
jgi:hypothetical protein